MRDWLLPLLPWAIGGACLFAGFRAMSDEPYCVEPGVLAAELRAEGQEARGGGLNDDGALIVLWGSEDRALWTLTVQGPDNIACIIDAGSSWEPLTPTPRPSARS